jgi:hypothetical protein
MRIMVLKRWGVVALFLMVSAGGAQGDFIFGTARSLGPVINSAANEAGIAFSSDDLELYFSSQRPGGYGDYDIWVSTRPSVADAWGPPVNLGAAVNSPYTELYPCLSSDGLILYFSDYYSGSPRPGGQGGGDIWMTTRVSRSDPWTAPVNLGLPVNSAVLDMSPTVSADGLTLAFTCRDRVGGYGSWDIWMATRPSVQDPWGPPMNLGPAVNSGDWDGESGLSADGRALVFGSGRPGLVGGYDLWISTRRTPADPWTAGVSLGPAVNSSSSDGTGRFSPDMRTLYFCSDRPDSLGGYDLYAVPLTPIVDFDGNERVDLPDLLRLIESWGQDDPAVDIGPGPWGDGVVDAADLEVLMSSWGREILSPALVAYWRLDEQEGTTAADSVGGHEATVQGGAQWEPETGRVRGALQLDGIDDYVATGAVLNPGAGPLSVFAWVKGGAPGQVILSQAEGANWLRAAPGAGTLETQLNEPGRNAGKNLSSAVGVTDAAWHRVGLVWDGKNRALYVDDVEVARGSLIALSDSVNELYLGAAGTLDPGTFWSGLIDDIRIYGCAVTP